MTIHDGKADWRTQETFQKYLESINSNKESNSCPLCAAESIEEYEYWRIVINIFPYDRIASVHHMILPKRHITYHEVTIEEQKELDFLLHGDLNKSYNTIHFALPKGQSIPEHLHYHLMVPNNI